MLVFVFVSCWVFVAVNGQVLPHEHCLVENLAGCPLGRPPIYLATVPRRVRPGQVVQVFATIFRMELGQRAISMAASIVREDQEVASTVVRFERPSSRIMQLRIPSNAASGRYRVRLEGRLDYLVSGAIFSNETDIEFSPKHVSVFIQMDRPIYRQEQIVHFRVIPVEPDLMPKDGNLMIYVEDPTGIAVKRWQGLQTNAGAIVSQSFQLSDQPTFGTWNILVEAFGHTYRRPFQVEEFWEPRFDVNVTAPAYVMDNDRAVVRGSVVANHTSGRPCVGNMTLTAFFLPRESVWLSGKGWEKPYRDAMAGDKTSGVPLEPPKYRSIKTIPPHDYHKYFEYEYRLIEYYQGRVEFEWTREELLAIAQRAGVTSSLVNSEFVFLANVTDWYSDVKRTGWAGTIMFDDSVKLEWVGGGVRTFKPGQLFKVQVAVSQYDGKPVLDGGAVTLAPIISGSASGANSPMNNPLTSPVVGGIARFEIQLDLNTQQIKLMATYNDPREALSPGGYADVLFVRSESASIEMIASKYYSPSNTYITVSSSTDNPMINQFMVFHVTTSHFVRRIYYQIISQGNVVIGDELEMTSRQKTFAVGLSRAMVPVARIVVYFMWQPEEVVSDVLSFFVNGTSQNVVKLGINKGKDFSRDTVEFNAEADPGSYVAFSGMLLDLYSRGLSDGITENRLIDELMTYDPDANKGYKQLQRVSDTNYEYKFFHGYDYGIDSTTTFESAGLIILTDADVTRLPNMDSCAQDQFPCFSGIESECFTEEQRCNGRLDGCPSDGADEWGCTYEDTEHAFHQSGLDRVSRVMRFYDNSSWAWQEIFVKPDGRVDFRVDVPKYPLSWVINGISVSRELGLGIMRQPVKLDAVRNMYIQVEHPKYIVWGEQIGVRVTVFNYWYEDDFLEVLVTMHPGRNAEFVLVEDMGFVRSYNPRTHGGDHQTIVFLEPGESRDIYMPIVPKRAFHGKQLEFRVSATCFMQKDEYEGAMFMQPNGVLNYYHTPYLIDLIRPPSLVSPSLKIEVEERFRKLEIRESMYVPQSPTAMVTLYGDVVTPGFFEDILNAENILYRPYGSGEMVTFNFAYNMRVLLFQRSSDQIKEEEARRVLTDLDIVLQRMFSYMNPDDGSFRMFRDDEKSSLWLTAFVAKTLVMARVQGDWEKYLYIPTKLLGKMVTYICSRQNATTGAFDPDENDLALDRKMASLKKSQENLMLTHRIPLTAYVLIALSDITGFSNTIEPAKREAARFLAEQAPSLGKDEVFFMAITAYALSLTQTTTDLVSRLWDLRRNDSNYIYFADQKVYGNPTKMLNTETYLDPRQELLNDAYAVQTTAYALMAHIRSNRPAKIERDMTMTWMNGMRNSFAGFASTQDTIVAMEALHAYAQKDPNRNEYGMDVSLTVSTFREWARTTHLTEEDFTFVHRSFLPENKVYGFIRSSTKGVGRAMLQLTTTKRVEEQINVKTQMRYDNDPEKDPIPFFSLELKIDYAGRNDSIMMMSPCVSWLYTDRSLTSGLAVLEVDLPTGYVVMNDTLRDYVRSGVVPNLRRAEFYGRQVIYYFDYLDQSTTCVDLRANRWFPVGNTTRENRIRVYDYYEPGMHNTRMYTVEGLHLMSICYACGSYQCPYCPNFNTGASLGPLGAVWFSLLLLLCVAISRLVTAGGSS